MLKPKRLRHAEGVLDYSVKLAEKHDVSVDSVKIAALYHDYFRNKTLKELLEMAENKNVVINPWERQRPILLHGKLAAVDLKEKYPEIENLDFICEAVKNHTSGYLFTSDIGKILFISDSVEVNRDFDGVEGLRENAMENLDETCFKILKNKIKHAIEKEHVILPETIIAYNNMIMNGVDKSDKSA
jgi:predicted HD superfamily hydrolase involved in NAD metabolism